MNEYETTNINVKWLENIYSQLISLQDLERMAREGCANIGEYMSIPLNLQRVVIPETRYKNMRFFALELDILINNLVPVLKGDIDKYKKRLIKIIENIDSKQLFLMNKKENNIMLVEITPLLNKTISILVDIKSEIIKDIGHILYIKEDEIKKW